jgi:hypothetical protein
LYTTEGINLTENTIVVTINYNNNIFRLIHVF